LLIDVGGDANISQSGLDSLIIPKLSAVLTDKQKKKKVENLLKALREAGKIHVVGHGQWELIK
jgi:hypothetical protein